MEIYVVIIGNYINSDTTTYGVFSSLEIAKRQVAPKDWFIDHYELWSLNGECVDSYIEPEEESEEKE